MFSPDFYPTPKPVIEKMLEGFNISGKTILEPSAGKGDIVDFCIGSGASVLACENHPDLQKILSNKCKLVGSDFFELKSEDISHIGMIIMNPPFSNAEKHILHAWDIAPAGCDIVALCNNSTIENTFSQQREVLKAIIKQSGSSEKLGDVFGTAERKTGVITAMVKIKKPGQSYESEFSGFFEEEDEVERQENGIMSYNVIRDLVQRYVQAIKIFDEQLSVGNKMSRLLGGYFDSELSFSCTTEKGPVLRNDFKKDLQKSGWKFIFAKMNMEKYSTKGLKEDLNKFVENQVNIPFTMRNIYHMIDIVIGTAGQRMNKALEEVFDKLTMHYDENRYHVEGWKTNSHYIMNEKFILGWMVEVNYQSKMSTKYSGNVEIIEDMQKALCWMTGTPSEKTVSLYNYFHMEISDSGEYPRRYQKYEFGQWYDWGFFMIKGYKKGTMHFKFKDRKLWENFNRKVAEIKGYPLPEKI